MLFDVHKKNKIPKFRDITAFLERQPTLNRVQFERLVKRRGTAVDLLIIGTLPVVYAALTISEMHKGIALIILWAVVATCLYRQIRARLDLKLWIANVSSARDGKILSVRRSFSRKRCMKIRYEFLLDGFLRQRVEYVILSHAIDAHAGQEITVYYDPDFDSGVIEVPGSETYRVI